MIARNDVVASYRADLFQPLHDPNGDIMGKIFQSPLKENGVSVSARSATAFSDDYVSIGITVSIAENNLSKGSDLLDGKVFAALENIDLLDKGKWVREELYLRPLTLKDYKSDFKHWLKNTVRVGKN